MLTRRQKALQYVIKPVAKNPVVSKRVTRKRVTRKRGVRFDDRVSALSSNEDTVSLTDMEKYNKENPRQSNLHYRSPYPRAKPYSLSSRALAQESMKWQTREEYVLAREEKQQEHINAGYRWSVDAVSDDFQTVTICNLENPKECETVSTREFKYFPIVGEIYNKIRYILGKGGKRTQKKRRTNKKRKN